MWGAIAQAAASLAKDKLDPKKMHLSAVDTSDIKSNVVQDAPTPKQEVKQETPKEEVKQEAQSAPKQEVKQEVQQEVQQTQEQEPPKKVMAMNRVSSDRSTKESVNVTEEGSEEEGSGDGGAKAKEILGKIGGILQNFKSDKTPTLIPAQNSYVAISDEQCKKYQNWSGLIDDFSKIDAYLFKYKPEAQQEYKGYNGVDNDTHIGVMAQELEQVPATQTTVSTDEKGNKQVDVRELTMTNTAAIAELARAVKAIQKILGER